MKQKSGRRLSSTTGTLASKICYLYLKNTTPFQMHNLSFISVKSSIEEKKKYISYVPTDSRTNTAKGRLSVPLSINFWKSSKRPLPPPRPFFGKNVAIFFYENFWNGNDPPKLAFLMLKILQRNFLDRK